MKYRLAIVEDEPNYAEYLKKLIEAYSDLFEIYSYYSSMSFLTANQDKAEKYDVVFMDIDMPELDGISLAKKLYNLSDKTIIVFVTNKHELVYEAFGLNVYKFICKDQLEYEIKKLLNGLERNVLYHKTVLLKSGMDTLAIRKEDIVLVEKYKKVITVTTKTGSYDLKMITLEEMMALLNENRFQYANRSSIINLKYVCKINKKSVKLNYVNKEIDISRYRSEHLLNSFYSEMLN